jgi:hypothetical protein
MMIAPGVLDAFGVCAAGVDREVAQRTDTGRTSPASRFEIETGP